MNKSFFTFIILAILAWSCSSEEASDSSTIASTGDSTARIEINIQGFTGGKVLFYRQYGQSLAHFRMDSVENKAGEAIVFQRDSLFPPGMYYVVLPDMKFFGLLLDKDQTLEASTRFGDMLGQMKITNCIDNELYYQDLHFEQDFRPRIDAATGSLKGLEASSTEYQEVEKEINKLIAERKAHIAAFKEEHPKSFFTEFKLAGQNPDIEKIYLPDGSLDTLGQVRAYRKAFFANTPLDDVRLLHTPIVGNKVRKYLDELIPFDRDSAIFYLDELIAKTKNSKEGFNYVANQAALKFKDPTFIGGDSVFVHLIDHYFTDEKAYWASPEELTEIRRVANERRPSMIGKQAQDLRCPSINGGYESLLDLTEPLLVLYMYSYECDHCRERTPSMVRVFQEWKHKGLDVYAICVDPDEAKWKAFVNEFRMQGMHNVHDPKYESEFYKKYHVDVTPEVYVLNKQRKIVAKDMHPDDLPGVFHKHLSD